MKEQVQVTKEKKINKTTIDQKEHDKFFKMAEEWWNPNGKFKTLHKFNPVRIAFIREKIINHFNINPSDENPFNNISLLDVGCGGGLLCEPMSKLGANVTGIDIVEKNIKTASAHAEGNKLPIKYQVNTVEELATKKTKYDVILNMEVIEHVSDVSLFIKSCSHLLSKDGIMIFASLNRTLTSYGLAIIGVEYILGWLPRGTHDWNKFITPDELKVLFKSNQLKIDELKGVKYNPIFDTWKISNDLSVNYLGLSKKISS
ncbi:bifunctional 2-polyprenyl-6-hydroxyphenol methylase/3-demethylubiquinol 3-O-methyltransferase UbiG [Hyphomicrobiales bacterium]|nr:bifunctional 2-polyprenyl-6-hydroxyphenol methylase/3-demethylubiquinol 3-O-methyltransferase UbiG [Hyphomicrobiales bacterium]